MTTPVVRLSNSLVREDRLWLDGLVAKSPFLADLHGGFGLPRPAVVQLAERAVGRRVEDVERIVRGYDNEVYRIESAGRLIVYLRIRRHGEGGFDQEAWAMGLARNRGIPVPEVLAVDTVSDAEGEQPVMVVAAAPGQQLEVKLASVSETDRHRALVDLGSVLAQLHSIATPGVWRADESGRWPEPDELRRGFVADRRSERGLLLTAGLTVAEADRAIELLDVSPDPPRSGFVL
jgi:aminoglycoside phosphotransferase (APT) family kinase protein